MSDLRARLDSVPDGEVISSVLHDAGALLRRIVAGETPSLGMRAHAQSILRTIEAIENDSLAQLRTQFLEELARQPKYSAAAEVEGWSGGVPDRPSGQDGLLHAALPGGGSVCGLPANVLDVLRSRFVPGRLNSCPICTTRIVN